VAPAHLWVGRHLIDMAPEADAVPPPLFLRIPLGEPTQIVSIVLQDHRERRILADCVYNRSSDVDQREDELIP
jgi:hypothetical protein